MDWRHPQANKAGAEVYMTYMRAQLQELITRYDPAILWFDGQWVDWWSDERGMALEEFVHRLKSNIICNGRLAKTNKKIGDFVVTEHQPPGPLLGDRLWERCQTTNASWGYKASDHQWKSLKELVKTLVDTTSSGGRLLLNVGPDARGKIPPECENVFLQVGAWLEKNGDSIFKSVPTKIRHPRWGRLMQGIGAQSHLVYATVYEWPTWPQSGELYLDINVRIRSATILATNEVLPLSLNTGGAQVMTLPEKLKESIPVVIALEMVADPVSATPATAASPTSTKTP
jgi:alpha-L-fucosidase